MRQEVFIYKTLGGKFYVVDFATGEVLSGDRIFDTREEAMEFIKTLGDVAIIPVPNLGI